MGEITVLSLSEFVLASGAVGTAAMGISEGFKSVKFSPIGFNYLEKELEWACSALKIAYGDDYLDLLKSLYSLDRRKGELPRILRQGIRIGMNGKTAKCMVQLVGDCTERSLSIVAKKVSVGKPLNEKEKNILGRFEIAADARIDGALALADRIFINGIRFRSFIVAIILSVLTSLLIGLGDANGFNYGYLVSALIVGFVAVPLAPVAKDVAKGLQSAVKALRAFR